MLGIHSECYIGRLAGGGHLQQLDDTGLGGLEVKSSMTTPATKEPLCGMPIFQKRLAFGQHLSDMERLVSA